MNAQTRLTMPAIERLAEAMRAEGIHQIRDWRPVGTNNAFTVELKDGRTGAGRSPREAIENAKAERKAA